MTSKLPVRATMLAAISFSAFLYFQIRVENKNHPRPTEVNFRQREGEENGEEENGHEKWFEATRSASLGPDWKEITRRNMAEWDERVNGAADRTTYAGGLLSGDWYERGCSNITGSISVFDLYNDEWYALGSSGSLWKGNLDGSTWTMLEHNIATDNRCLEVINNGGTTRILATYDGDIRYSDNLGSSWTTVAIASYNDGRQLLQLPNGDLYYLAKYYWGGHGLHRSTNGGTSWSVIKSWTGTGQSDQVSMWQDFQTNNLYVLDGTNKLYSVSGATVTLINTGTGLPTASSRYLTGYTSGGTTKFFATVGGNSFWRSTDNGLTWTQQSSLSSNGPWSFAVMANPSTGAVYYGGVEFWKSTDDGVSWTHQNNWWDYYGNINLLHADMMCLRPVRTGGGTNFFAIGCHGGLYVSYDNFASTTNVSQNNLRYSDLYDVVTVGGTIMAGAQDQGWHKFAGGGGTSILSAIQPISGDYVRMNTSSGVTKLWAEYPNGDFAYYSSPNSASPSVTDWYTIGGSANSNFQQWVVPTCANGNSTQNSIYVGGGTLAGGGSSGSYLLKLTGGNPVTGAQVSTYDFQAANGGSGWISAVENSPVDPTRFYVGMNGGKFFYSTNSGSTWTSPTFTGPAGGWNYGSFIYASRLSATKLWYCGGSGKVYQSINGGANWTQLATGMPNTFISELATNATETLLFAATDAGPYVYVFQTNSWYSLADASTPLVYFTSVEALSGNIMRFTTNGRGVWDFQITAAPLPVELASFDGKLDRNNDVQLNWQTASEQNLDRFDVERSRDGVDFEKIGQAAAENRASNYRFTDFSPLEGGNIYRLRSVDRDAAETFSKTVAVEVRAGKTVKISPNPAVAGGTVRVEYFKEGQSLDLFDGSGRLVFTQKLDDGNTRLAGLTAGAYYFQVKDEGGGTASSGKLVVRN